MFKKNGCTSCPQNIEQHDQKVQQDNQQKTTSINKFITKPKKNLIFGSLPPFSVNN
jgi:hypothetical protein